jgi:hypothetical protein
MRSKLGKIQHLILSSVGDRSLITQESGRICAGLFIVWQRLIYSRKISLHCKLNSLCDACSIRMYSLGDLAAQLGLGLHMGELPPRGQAQEICAYLNLPCRG